MPDVKPDPALEPDRLRGRQRIVQHLDGLNQQVVGSVDTPREYVGLCCEEATLGLPLLVGRELHCAFQKFSRGGIAVTGSRLARCRL